MSIFTGNSNSTDFAEAKAAITRWIAWYNEHHPHQALGYLSPHHIELSNYWRWLEMGGALQVGLTCRRRLNTGHSAPVENWTPEQFDR